MELWANESVLSLFLGKTEAYFFDRSGRFFGAWDQGWFISHGLSGRSVARRWEKGRRDVRALNPPEIEDLEKKARRALEIGLGEHTTGDVAARLRRSLFFDRREDVERFRSVYRVVGILPPDQYGACVVQVTEGCAWNDCHFCAFYRNQPYRLKTPTELKVHLRDVANFFGEGLSLRRSIFLGEANALAAPVDALVEAMEGARAELIPGMPHFRGFYAFNEIEESACRSETDFRVLAAAGLRRIYYGFETGDPELRRRLGKPGSLDTLRESVHNAKAAGVRVALIILAGAGGHAWAEAHVNHSIAFLRDLPLDEADLIFVSPLHGPDGIDTVPLAPTETESQVTRLREALADKARVARYDIREFVY